MLVGDFNLPSINWNTLTSSEVYSNQFLDLLDEVNLEQLINDPTRFRAQQNPSLLDLILTNDSNIINDIKIGDAFGKSDHCRIEFNVKNNHKPKVVNKHKFNYRKMMDEIFKNEMNQVNWREILTGELDEAYAKFLRVVTGAIENSTPLLKKKDKNVAPWSNKLISKLAKKKRKDWDRYKYTKTIYDYETYKITLNQFNLAKDEAVRNFEHNIIGNKNRNRKLYYNYVSGKSKYENNKIILKSGEKMETEEDRCAEIMNRYFSSVFLQDNSNFNVDISKLPNVPDMPDFQITAETIRGVIDGLDTSKSTGPDSVPALVIKKFSDVFVPILEVIFNRSYQEGIVPKLMKIANITPLHKAGDKTLPENYRPVSLTPIIAKMMEKIVKEKMERHIEEQMIMSEMQHGFRKLRSTSTNLLQFTNEVINIANGSKSVSIVYTDLRKAFDRVPHDLLLFKLSKYGFRGKTIQWLKDFLHEREQRVCIGSVSSSSKRVMSGVPQGGVLSGLLFSLYINDLPDYIENSSISIYADDTKIFSEITSQESVSKLQRDLDSMVKWCKQWRLELNPTKFYVIQYNPRSELRKFNPSYKIDGAPLEKKSQIRDLGIIVSEDLKFHAQVDSACKRAHAEINRIRRSFISRSPQFLAEMFKMYVRPHLEYAVEVWNPKAIGDIKKMEKVQNKMTKLIPTGRSLTPEDRNRVLGLTSHENDAIEEISYICSRTVTTRTCLLSEMSTGLEVTPK